MIGFTPDILTRGQELALTKMRATVLIQRKIGTAWDEETGTHVPTFETVYEGPAELRISDLQPRDADVAGRRIAELVPFVALPMIGEHAATAAAARFDDTGEVLVDLDNPGNVGTKFRVSNQHVKSLATARRYPVEVLNHA